MCAANNGSLEVSYTHIADMQAILAAWLTDVPREILALFDKVLEDVVLSEFKNYKQVRNKCGLRCRCDNVTTFCTDLP
jgi:DNA replicative helicase MCM subunit Mcm2 (Cdc46/Mcm family)